MRADTAPTRPPRERVPGEDDDDVAPVRLAKVGDAFPLLSVRDIPEILKQDWLVESLIPRFATDGTAGYLFGAEKSRKSLLAADIALSVTTGTAALGHFKVARTGAAVGFFAEDPKPETARRIKRMARARGVEVPENLYLIDVSRLALDNADDQARLAVTLAAVTDLAFVWFDPMVRLHSVNDNRAEELGPIHTFLRTLSRSLPGAVILLAHHAVKDGENYRGSTDYGAFGDFNLFGRKVDAYTTQIRALEFRGGPPGKPFSYTVEDGRTVDGEPTMRLVVSDVVSDADAEQQDDVRAQIIAYKVGHPGTSGKAALRKLRTLGLAFSNDTFWDVWKN